MLRHIALHRNYVVEEYEDFGHCFFWKVKCHRDEVFYMVADRDTTIIAPDALPFGRTAIIATSGSIV